MENVYIFLQQIYSGNSTMHQISSESPKFCRRYYENSLVSFYPDTVYCMQMNKRDVLIMHLIAVTSVRNKTKHVVSLSLFRYLLTWITGSQNRCWHHVQTLTTFSALWALLSNLLHK